MEDISQSANEADDLSMCSDYSIDDSTGDEDANNADDLEVDDDSDDEFFTNLLIQRLQTNNPPKVEYGFSLADKDDIDLVILAKMLQTNTLTTSLYFNHDESSRVTIIGWQAIFEMLQINRTIQSLAMNYVNCHFEYGHLFSAIQSTLQNICLCSFRVNDASAVVDALCKNPKGCMLQSLTFQAMDKNEMNIELQKTFARNLLALLQQTNIKEIHLIGNSLGDEFIAIFANGLKKNSHLKVLDLDGNKITDNGANELAKALHYNQTLVALELQNNKLSVDGVNAITRALRYHPTLEKLHIRFDDLNDECEPGLFKEIEFLQYNESLRDFDYNDDWNPAELLSLLDHNDTIHSIYDYYVDDSDDEDEDMKYSLTEILLEKNHAGERIAPKKGLRRRQDVNKWLYSNWIWMNKYSKTAISIPSSTVVAETLM